MAETAKIPAGFGTLTPSLSLPDAAMAIDLYKRAFGAKEIEKMKAAGSNKIMHACLAIGTSKVFINDVMHGGDTPTVSSFYMYLEDVDTAMRMAKEAGMKETFPVENMFWGDRMGSVKDAFGNSWTLATHVRDVSPEEMEEGGKKFAEMCKAKDNTRH